MEGKMEGEKDDDTVERLDNSDAIILKVRQTLEKSSLFAGKIGEEGQASSSSAQKLHSSGKEKVGEEAEQLIAEKVEQLTAEISTYPPVQSDTVKRLSGLNAKVDLCRAKLGRMMARMDSQDENIMKLLGTLAMASPAENMGKSNFIGFLLINLNFSQLLGLESSGSLCAMLACRKFSYLDILVITNSLSEIVGSGAFGDVYKGALLRGDSVAVKKLSENCKQGEKEFLAEVELLGKTKHPKLVSLIGYCCQDNHRFIVYEFEMARAC